MNKYWFASVFVIVLFLAALTGCGGKKGSHSGVENEKGLVTVEVITVQSDSASGMTVYVGTVSSSKTASISAPARGTLTSMAVREGERVSAGQTLGKIFSQALESSFMTASASLAQAEDAWTRIQPVYKSGTVTEVEYMRVKTQVEQARSVEAAARDALQRCTLKAPFAGVVERIWPAVGADVEVGEQVVRVMDIGAVEVHFPLPESEYHLYAAGTAASVEIPALGQTFEGRLATKGIVASALSHSYDCTVALKRSYTGILPGMVCKVSLHSQRGASVVIPASAVMTDMEGRYVWMVVGDVVDKRHVEVAGFCGDGIVISHGLDEGEQVIVEGSRKVSTGMRVKTKLR